jgi:mRNA degradation ribonuclease J1/J2
MDPDPAPMDLPFLPHPFAAVGHPNTIESTAITTGSSLANIRPCGFSLDEEGKPNFDGRYHASGHASGEDIARAIEQIDPDWIVPIHTEARGWFEEMFENAVMVEEGKQYKL